MLILLIAYPFAADADDGRKSARAEKNFIVSVTVDFPDDLQAGTYSTAALEAMMRYIRDLGARRVYWIYYGEIDKRSYWAGDTYDLIPGAGSSIGRIGELLKAVVPIAHRYGLEIYGVLKPYNTGITATFPEGAATATAGRKLHRIGGRLQLGIPFVENHPQTLIERRPLAVVSGANNAVIRKIRLLKKDNGATRIKADNLEIWTSADNYKYAKANIRICATEESVRARNEVRDYYGNIVTPKGALVRALTLTNLSLTDNYVLITTNFGDAGGDFQNTAVAMIEAYGDGADLLPVVVATANAVWITPRDFRTYGLEFDSGLGNLLTTLDVSNRPAPKSTGRGNHGPAETAGRAELGWGAQGGFVAFARGKNEYLPAVCEAYPEVKRLWLGWIGLMLDAGVDGVDLRVSAHGTLTDEPYAYGFNPLLMDEYRARFGASTPADRVDLGRLAELRGDYYTEFIREASHRVHRAGKKFQVHLHAEAFRDHPSFGQLMGFPANVKFDWKTWLKEGLLDGATLRTSWFEGGEDQIGKHGPAGHRSELKHALNDPIVAEMLAACGERGVPVYLNRYVGRNIGVEAYAADMETVFRNPEFSGFDIYEFYHLARLGPDGRHFLPVAGRPAIIQAKVAELAGGK